MRVDYHLHTPLCNHARGVMDAYVRHAVEIGFKEICFLDHLTIRKIDGGLSMTPGEVPLYFQAVQRLKYRYKDAIQVKTGLEVDFDPEYADYLEDIINTYAFDVIGCSVHYLGDFDVVTSGSAWKNGEGDTDHIYGRYLCTLEKMLDYTFFDVLCHFDLLKKFGRLPSNAFDDRFFSLLQKVKERGIAVELNTSGYNHPVGEAYPSLKILKWCRKLDIPVTLGSDSHAPEHIGRHYDRAEHLLISAGYQTLTTFTNRIPETIRI